MAGAAGAPASWSYRSVEMVCFRWSRVLWKRADDLRGQMDRGIFAALSFRAVYLLREKVGARGCVFLDFLVC